MTTFTVHEPPPRKNEATASPVRFAFVRDGFYFWAFLLGPVWMLYHRLWLVLLMYLAGTTAMQVALWALGVSGLVKVTVSLLIAVLVGFEAGTLRRTLLRVSPEFWRALGPALAAACATGLGAWAAVALGGRFVHGAGGWRSVELLALAIVAATAAYGAVVFVFRRALALGRRA